MLLRIASVLLILHICYHPWHFCIYSFPIKDGTDDISINDGIHNKIEQLHDTFVDEEHEEAVEELLNSTSLANISSSMLRSDYVNSSDPFELSTRRQLSYIIWISKESWANYRIFKQETCRTENEDYPKFFGDQDFLESGYFKWEENEFHRELRVLLFPDTFTSLKPLVDQDVISRLDKRFMQKPLESFCYQKEIKHTEEEEAAEERSKFEDTVLNRVFEPR